MTFQRLDKDERKAWFETFVHFEAKFGLLLRCCDSFSAVADVYDLFLQIRLATSQALQLPHARLWYVDRSRNHVVCVFNDSADDRQNGRTLPLLGSFPGEIVRNKKTLVSNRASADSRFGSWQLKEMQDALGEPLGCIAGVALLDASGDAQYVLEAYSPDETRELDGADAFLMQMLADYSGPAILSVNRRWQHTQISLLPSLLLENDTFIDFLEGLRRQLMEVFCAADADVFIVEAASATASAGLWHVKRDVSGDKPSLKRRSQSTLLPTTTRQSISLTQRSVVCTVAKQAVESNSNALRICADTRKEDDFSEEIDSKSLTLLTFSVHPETSQQGTNSGALAIVQLRDRLWQGPLGPRPDVESLKRCAGFGKADMELADAMSPHLARALCASLNVEESRKAQYEANRCRLQAQSIMNLTNCIAQGIDINELFPIVVEEVTKLLQCDRATMFLLTDDEKSLWSMVRSTGTGPLIKIQVPVTGESIAGSCVSTKTTINLKDAYTDARFNKKTDRTTGYRTRSLLAIPLHDSRTQNVRGCMQCLNKLNNCDEAEDQFFDEGDLALATTFAAFVAAAIERAKFTEATGNAVNMAIKTQTKQ